MDKVNEEVIALNPAKTALLLLHWQNDLAAPSGKMAGDMTPRLASGRTIEHTQSVLKAARDKGMLVVYVNASHRPGYPEVSPRPSRMTGGIARSGSLVRGTWGAEVIDRLKPLPDEIVILNFSHSSFAYTELDLILRNRGITDLVLSGLVTNWIVESTARDAANRSYKVYTLQDCCQGVTPEMHQWSLTNILSFIGTVIDSQAFIAALPG
jgi:nicotinamidase-related amidase